LTSAREAASLPVGYAGLGPQQVLDALDAAGLRGDGRLLQLNSYENRVFQVMLEDGRPVVAKFYRPGRWSDAQILEEHAFALELAADGHRLVYGFDTRSEDSRIADLLRRLHDAGVDFSDLNTEESSLEDIFVSLVREPQ
jgi:hypothetical protein